jgi:hypothetical protein
MQLTVEQIIAIAVSATAGIGGIMTLFFFFANRVKKKIKLTLPGKNGDLILAPTRMRSRRRLTAIFSLLTP